ncbi:MAG: type II toxin-antitoxin system HigB family toxin [Acidobacteriota bacterium]|nr:type II toxin-antitoxin system HigB family toxin [Acidobacteriota bacterium]
MRIISKRALREFRKDETAAENPLEDWYRSVRKSDWENFADIWATFRHADVFRDCVIFDVGGDNYRLIAKVRYQKKKVFVRFILSHSEYDNDKWKSDC